MKQLSLRFLSLYISGLLFTAVCIAEPPASQVIAVAENNATTDAFNKKADLAVKPVARLWNLQDADILSVINEVSQETGKNFVVDPRVSGKITLISSKPLRQNDVYQVFLSVLSILGFSAIEEGNIVKIVPNMESGEQGSVVATNRLPGQGDEVVVRVIPLSNVSATQLIPVIRPLLPQWSNISAYTPGNVLILLGRASNLERIATVIYDVDKASNSGIQVIPLRRASAVQVGTVLNNLQNAARATGESPAVSIAVDERSNSILLSGPKAMRLRMRVLIAQLDAPAATSGNTEVIYLRYLEAKTFAPLLSKIAQSITGKSSGGYDSNPGMGNMSSGSGAQKDTSKQSDIQAEPNTNAIIITAPPTLMHALKSVITKLDIRPAEVLVEAIIAEIDESNITSLGIQWGSVGPGGQIQTQGTGTSVTSFPALGAGIVGIMPHTQIQAVLSILRNQNGVDILSTPSVLVLDNRKAMIEIGQDVPFQTGSFTTPTGANANTVQPYNTVSSKPVTLRLDVTPQINLHRSVKLLIKLKNDTLQNPQNPTLTPIINTSKIQNSVIINSDDVLVIGGLMSKSNNENINKVPILGDLPFVGFLFQQKTKNQQKKNLVVFIKPIIVSNPEDGNLITHMKYSTTRSIQANFREELSTIGDKPVDTRLPPWRNAEDLPKPFETCCDKSDP